MMFGEQRGLRDRIGDEPRPLGRAIPARKKENDPEDETSSHR